MESIAVSREIYDRTNGDVSINDLKRKLMLKRTPNFVALKNGRPVPARKPEKDHIVVVEKRHPIDMVKRTPKKSSQIKTIVKTVPTPVLKVAKTFTQNSEKAKAVQKKQDYVPVMSKEEKAKVIAKGGNVKEVVKKVTEKSPDNVITKQSFEILKPLKPVFAVALEYVGVQPSKDLQVLAEQTYNNIVRMSPKTGASNFSYDYPYVNLAHASQDSVDVAKDSIINAIIGFVKNVKLKESAGQPLTKVEQIVADGTSTVEANLKEAAKKEAAEKIGESLLFDKKTQWIIGGILVFVILIVFLIARK